MVVLGVDEEGRQDTPPGGVVGGEVVWVVSCQRAGRGGMVGVDRMDLVG